MKRILIVAVIASAIASPAFSQTSRNTASGQWNNVEQTSPHTERESSVNLSAATRDENASQCNTLTFITESLPDFTIGTPANYQIEISGGTAPYSFKITEGKLPKGLKLSKDGLITGTPTEEADTTVFVTVTDSAGCNLTQAFAVRVNPALSRKTHPSKRRGANVARN